MDIPLKLSSVVVIDRGNLAIRSTHTNHTFLLGAHLLVRS
jgi:hypothetical protein